MTTKPDAALMPCPFCGMEAFVLATWNITCSDEDGLCPGSRVDCRREQWNTRTPATAGESTTQVFVDEGKPGGDMTVELSVKDGVIQGIKYSEPASEPELVEEVARGIFPLISGDPEDDHENPFVQQVAKAALAIAREAVETSKRLEQVRMKPTIHIDGEFAFPVTDQGAHGCCGMTLRQWYAGMAMQGLLAGAGLAGPPLRTASLALEFADALIAGEAKR